MAYWICEVDGESIKHVHKVDAYFTVVQGKYALIINDHIKAILIGLVELEQGEFLGYN